LEMPVKHLSRSLSHEEERAVSPAGMSLSHVSSAAEALRSRGYRRTHSCAIHNEPHSAAAAQSVPRRGCVESSRIDRKNSIYYFFYILYYLADILQHTAALAQRRSLRGRHNLDFPRRCLSCFVGEDSISARVDCANLKQGEYGIRPYG